jgi:hypothetical protein
LGSGGAVEIGGLQPLLEACGSGICGEECLGVEGATVGRGGEEVLPPRRNDDDDDDVIFYARGHVSELNSRSSGKGRPGKPGVSIGECGLASRLLRIAPLACSRLSGLRPQSGILVPHIVRR